MDMRNIRCYYAGGTESSVLIYKAECTRTPGSSEAGRWLQRGQTFVAWAPTGIEIVVESPRGCVVERIPIIAPGEGTEVQPFVHYIILPPADAHPPLEGSEMQPHRTARLVGLNSRPELNNCPVVLLWRVSEGINGRSCHQSSPCRPLASRWWSAQ